MFVIHNMGFQGKYDMKKFPPPEHLGLYGDAIEDIRGEDANWKEDTINLMKGAIVAADRVLTVSPNYANEICSPEGGQGLDGLLRDKGGRLRLAGILNGIADEWNPRTDPHIFSTYGKSDFEEGKAKNKADLQKKLGLDQDPNVALIGFCARLDHQKGIGLVTAIIPWLMQDQGNGVNGRVQLVLMGKGNLDYANQLQNAEGNHRGRICGYVGFDPRVEHQIMAGCDLFLMPSLYEPCGLPQMYAQAYATLPIVHETGGLKDSVRGLWDEGRDRTTATGFMFAHFNENSFKERVYQALEVYHKKKDLYRQMQLNCLNTNNYWPQAIDEYERHIDWTLESEPARW
jgi:starch synthase